MDPDKTRQLIDGLRIPPIPHILQDLHKELHKEEPVLTEIAGIVAQDVGISSLVLRTMNSPFFGLKSKVRSIQHAVSLLGIAYTVNIVAGLALRRSFEESGGPNPPNFWDSPVNIAMVSAEIAQRVGQVAVDEAYTLGLFHNAGHALLIQKHHDYAAFLIRSLNREDALVTDLEDERYQTQHAIVGYFMALNWGLDKNLAMAIRDHHQVVERLSSPQARANPLNRMLCVLKMAEHVDKSFWGMNPDHEWNVISEAVLDHMGMSEPDFEELRADMRDKLTFG